MKLKFLNEQQILDIFDMSEFIEALRDAMRTDCTVPDRSIYDQGGLGSLLMMPAMDFQGYYGIKIVTVRPGNRAKGLKTIQGLYTLYDHDTGEPLLALDASTVTNLRTAAASALAASYLAHPGSKTLLMAGAGALAPYIIEAHEYVRPIDTVYVWSKSGASAQTLAESRPNATAIHDIDQYLARADIISCATPAKMPLVHGKHLRAGQHIDLIGGYTREMRESDDETIRRATVFVDDYAGALAEAGDLIQPLEKGIFKEDDIAASLFELCRQEHPGRQDANEITLFKSVGHAIEDIALAVYLFDKMKKSA